MTDLPPLPEPAVEYETDGEAHEPPLGHAYTAQQMRDYVATDRDQRQAEPLTDAQCDAFRRHNGDFNDMVRNIFAAGRAQRQARQKAVAWRTRYKSEAGMIGNYPWTYTERARAVERLNPSYEAEPLYTAPSAAQDQAAEIARLQANEKPLLQAVSAQAAEIAALKVENEDLRITLRGIATSSPDESGCYYTNRANISTAKMVLARAVQP